MRQHPTGLAIRRRTPAQELGDCRVQLIRLVGRIESCVGVARASAATLPIIQALAEVTEMERWAERQDADR